MSSILLNHSEKNTRLFGCLLVLVTLLCCISGCWQTAETVFAPGYTEKKFAIVQLGAESNHVVELLGSPLRIDFIHFSEQWIYGGNAATQSSKSGLFVKHQNIRVPTLVLNFGRDGSLTSYFGEGGERCQGKNKEAIRALLGQPDQTRTNAQRTILNYTEGRHTECFYVRAIILNQDGRVAEKKSFLYRK